MITVKKHARPKPVALIMLEGWGIAPASNGNKLINSAPYFSHLAEHYPVAALVANGESIGLSANVLSNGEIAETVIGSGREFFEANQFINKKIAQDLFTQGQEFAQLNARLNSESICQLIGLISSSDKEASLNHLKALVNYLSRKNVAKINLHLILDGRETNKNAGQKLVEELSEDLAKYPTCRIASLVGRLYALDDKSNFSRTIKATNLFVLGEGSVFPSATEAFTEFYDKKIFDEEFPTVILGEAEKIKATDTIIFFNHSGQGICQLASYLANHYAFNNLVSLVDYGLGDKFLVLFSKPELGDTLGTIFSKNNLKQLRLADSSGFFNVTKAFDAYAFNFFEGLDKKIIPTSSKTELVDCLINTIRETKRLFNEAVQKSVYDFIVVTLAQIDVMAHYHQRDNLEKVVSAFDDNIKSMIEIVEASGGVAIIVGTHGFAEQIIDQMAEREIFSHSTNLVPCYLVGKNFEGYNLGWPEALGGDLSLLKPIGSLVDLAPTILTLADLPIPKIMTGKNLI